jgi:NAD(P)-dependent dehydrogenase (short-subunit alcohol dehydrogenase family)
MRLKGKRAFITGATSGIGAVMAQRFAEQGAMVTIAARREALGQAVAEKIRKAGGQALFQRMDIADEQSVKASITRAAEHFGGLDVLVNNAGPVDLVTAGVDRVAHLLDTDGFDKVMKITLYGPFWCCKYALPYMMQANKGSIVNISSVAAVSGLPGLPAYSAGKGGLSALTRSLAFDYGRYNIRANGIITGLIIHEGSAMMVDTPEKVAARRATHLTRLGCPDDIASAAIYLASDESDFVTGSHINVEGGVLTKSRQQTELMS